MRTCITSVSLKIHFPRDFRVISAEFLTQVGVGVGVGVDVGIVKCELLIVTCYLFACLLLACLSGDFRTDLLVIM